MGNLCTKNDSESFTPRTKNTEELKTYPLSATIRVEDMEEEEVQANDCDDRLAAFLNSLDLADQ